MSEPAQRRTDADGSKYYDHPFRVEDDPERPGHQRPARYDSVTTILSVAAKPALVYWASNLAAKRAMDNLPQLMGSLLVPDCGRSAARTEPYGCKECAACVRRWVALFHQGEKERRAREGSALHDVWERWTKTGELIYIRQLTGDPDIDQYVPTDETMAPYVAQLRRFIDDYGLIPEDVIVCECTVWNHTLKYAGTLDCIIDLYPRTKLAADAWARIAHAARVEGVQADGPMRILVDLKSREGGYDAEAEQAERTKPAIYPEYALQVSPYRSAETMLPKHAAPEMEAPMLSTDGAAILQVRPDGYTFRPVVADGRTFAAFRGYLEAYRWQAAHGDESVLVRAFPLPAGWKWQPPIGPGGKGPCDARGHDPIECSCQLEPKDAPKAQPRKRAPVKRAAKKATPPAAAAAGGDVPANLAGGGIMASIRQQPAAWPDVPPDDIPF